MSERIRLCDYVKELRSFFAHSCVRVYVCMYVRACVRVCAPVVFGEASSLNNGSVLKKSAMRRPRFCPNCTEGETLTSGSECKGIQGNDMAEGGSAAPAL